VLRLQPGRFTFVDSSGAKLVTEERLTSDGIVAGGVWWPNETAGDASETERYQPQANRTHIDVVCDHFGCGGHG
ncbi:amidohydrolase/deacetylase family metallohydrolase, partial [Rhizobiaceae sp. 2RAB30]